MNDHTAQIDNRAADIAREFVSQEFNTPEEAQHWLAIHLAIEIKRERGRCANIAGTWWQTIRSRHASNDEIATSLAIATEIRMQ